MLTEADILDRYRQSLGEAAQASKNLARNADPERAPPRGRDYAILKRSLTTLEGCCRQMGTWRGDARWIRLGALYAKILLQTQPKFVLQRWAWFGALPAHFEHGLAALKDLKDRRTGLLSSTPILPNRASEWLAMPEVGGGPPMRRTLH